MDTMVLLDYGDSDTTGARFGIFVIRGREVMITGQFCDQRAPTEALIDGGWHHIVATLGSDDTTSYGAIYLDGQPIPVDTPNGVPRLNTTNSPISIGRAAMSLSATFYGFFDDVQLYDVELSPEDVLALFTMQATRPSPSPTPVLSPSSLPYMVFTHAWVSECNGTVCTLFVSGNGLQSLCDDGFFMSFSNAAQLGINVCNNTVMGVLYLAVQDPGTFYWSQQNLVTIRNSGDYTVPGPIFATVLQPPYTCNATLPLQWGDVIEFRGHALGSATSAMFYLDDDSVYLLCANRGSLDADSFYCTVRTWTIELSDRHVGVYLQFDATSATLNFSMTFQWPSAVSVSDVLLSQQGGTSVQVVLPQPPWEQEDIEQVSYLPSFVEWCTLHVGSLSVETICPGSQTFLMTTPPGNGVRLPAFLEQYGQWNISLGLVSYQHAGFVSMTMSVLLAPLDLVTTIQLDVVLPSDAIDMENLAIAGVPCLSIHINMSTITCNLSVPALLQQQPTPFTNEIPLIILFDWGTHALSYNLGAIGVIHPILTSVIPQVLNVGSVLIAFGTHFCPDVQCNSTDLQIFVGPYPCLDMNVILDTVATCTAPSVSTSDATFPAYNVSVAHSRGRLAFYTAAITYPTTGFVAAIAPLPSYFIPSDLSAPFAVERDIVVTAVANRGESLDLEDLKCSLATTTAGVLVLPITLSDLANIANSSLVNFGRIGVQAAFKQPTVSMSVTCSSSSTTTSLYALTWSMLTLPLRTVACSLPPTSSPSQQVLPAFQVVLALPNATDAAACSRSAWVAPVLPSVMCTISATSNVSSKAVVLNGAVELDTISAKAVFTAVSLSGEVDVTYTLNIQCAIGTVVIPPAIESYLLISGCAAGSQPIDTICAPCAGNQYSDGGSMACVKCPAAGVDCTDGLLKLLPGYFRPPRKQGLILDDKADLYACPEAAACSVNTTDRTYACTRGYQGVLCGVCDDLLGYSRVGPSCVPCVASAVNYLLLVGVVIAAATLLGGMVLRKREGSRDNAAIALRILLTHVQATGSIRAFKASGTELYKAATSWADVLSSSVASQGPFECILRPSFTSIFFSMLLAPVIACLTSMLILVSALALKRSINASEPPLSKSWKATVEERRPHAILMFVSQLAYMPIVSVCLNVFYCSSPVDDVRYLVNDIRVACEGNAYSILAISAGIALLLVGIGLPVALGVVLGRATKEKADDPQFHAVYGFIYDGYRRAPLPSHNFQPGNLLSLCFSNTSKSVLWWESVVLLRKAGIVLIGKLISEPLVQIACFLIWVSICLVAHLVYKPYIAPRFQFTEGLSLMSIMLTAALSVIVLAVPDGSPLSLVITILMILINLVTVLVLLVSFLALRCSKVTALRARLTRSSTMSRDTSTPTSGLLKRPSQVVRLSQVHMNDLTKDSSMFSNPTFVTESVRRVDHPTVSTDTANPLLFSPARVKKR
jgi:hypothetical protein